MPQATRTGRIPAGQTSTASLSRLWRRQTELDGDGMHVVMGVAMAGMLVARLNPLPAQFGCARQRSVRVSEIRLSLLTSAGTPLPGSDRRLKIRETAFGMLALVIVGVALGVLVITFVARVLRRGMREADPVASGRKTTERDDDGSAEARDEFADARGRARPDARQ